MKGFSGIILIFVVLYMLFLPIAYLNYAREAEREFSGLLLAKAADYAGEAAMAACMEVTHIETEYANTNHMVLSPERAADSFASLMCLSYGLPITQWNLDTVKQMIPVMTLAVNDGYYIAERQETESGESSLMWSLKRPYTVDVGTDTLYGVELGMDVWRSVDKQTLTLSTQTGYSALPFDRETVLQQINLAINRDVNAALTRYANEHGGYDIQGFYLPLSDNTIGVRRIERPSLIVVMRDVDLDGVRPADLSVVSGMTVAQKNVVIGWTDDAGCKYYCYDGDADSTAAMWAQLNGMVFSTVEEAAQAGYAPYPSAFS